ncbi:MAG: SRPBCC family protein [Archangium sp.]
MKLALIIIAVLVALVLVMFIVGAMLPKDHVASRSVTLSVPPEVVFALISDVKNAPSWRSGLSAVEGDEQRFIEVTRHGRIPFRVLENTAPSKRVAQIDDPSLPFGGTWTWELVPEGTSGTRVTVTERGTVGPPLFRFLSRFVFGHDGTLKQVLNDLQRHFTTTSQSAS